MEPALGALDRRGEPPQREDALEQLSRRVSSKTTSIATATSVTTSAIRPFLERTVCLVLTCDSPVPCRGAEPHRRRHANRRDDPPQGDRRRV